MSTYIGFSTRINNTTIPNFSNESGGVVSKKQGKKFRLVDEQLVVQDLINALNINRGEKIGNPKYGTTLWSFIFEPNTSDTQSQLEDEIRRVANLDPRLILNSVRSYPQEHGILIELELAIAPFNQAQFINVFFNQETTSASLQ
jgi:phage baseplate assembly protein W